ncbi:22883_t:CDS:1, partial [Cetraspora pellucida]
AYDSYGLKRLDFIVYVQGSEPVITYFLSQINSTVVPWDDGHI